MADEPDFIKDLHGIMKKTIGGQQFTMKSNLAMVLLQIMYAHNKGPKEVVEKYLEIYNELFKKMKE